MHDATNPPTNDLGRTEGDWTLEYDGSLVMAGQIIGIGVDTASGPTTPAGTRSGPTPGS